MKVMVVGGGGREHAIIKKLKSSPQISELFAVPGNGGIAQDAKCVEINATDISKIVAFATENKIDYAVVAPDDPLVLGAVDRLQQAGIPCFGPDKNAAIIEGSKVFAKDLMKNYQIPTAKYNVFSNVNDALDYIKTAQLPIVIKADGLALGKGVIIAQTIGKAKQALLSIMEDKVFGDSGNNVVIEEFLSGPEVSILTFTDGETIIPMVSSMDHKRALDDDKGLNTGGMGAVSPNPFYTNDTADKCMETIFKPTINAMKSEGRTFKGCLYFGLMLTKDGPKVIEFNCRFGDPETQVVLPVLKTDLLEVMQAVTNGTLDRIKIEFANESACCVIMASKGYPRDYQKGFEIIVPENLDSDVFIAGARQIDNKLVTSSGRVLGVTATADTLESAITKAYSDVEKIKFEGAFYRKDIGKKALNFKKGTIKYGL